MTATVRGEPEDVVQPSSAVGSALPAKPSYCRDLPHFQTPGKTISITFATSKRWTLPESVRSLVLECCVYAHRVRFDMHAAVIMPDHVHLLLTPRRDASGGTFGLAQILNSIKGASAHAVNKAPERRGSVWQSESFDHVLRSDENRRATAEYICANPVRAGLARVEDAYTWLWREWVEGGVFLSEDPGPTPTQPGTAVPHRQPGTAALRRQNEIEESSKHG